MLPANPKGLISFRDLKHSVHPPVPLKKKGLPLSQNICEALFDGCWATVYLGAELPHA